MMEKFCQGSVLVQTKVKNKKNGKKKVAKPKQPSKEEVSVRGNLSRGRKTQRVNFSMQEKLADEWDARISTNLAVVLSNDINLPEEEHPVPLDAASEKPIDEQR